MRYGLMIKRLDKIKANHKVIETDFNNLNTKTALDIIQEIKMMKGKAFDGGCTFKTGNFRFNQTYKVQPVVLLSQQGLKVTLTNLTGVIDNSVEFAYDKEFINITSISTQIRDYPLCWLVVPGADTFK